MDNVTRFKRGLNFQSVDYIPAVEWAGYWNKTVDRWHGEGLPTNLTNPEDIRKELELDSHRNLWHAPMKTTCPDPEEQGPLIHNESDYEKLLPCLYPKNPLDTDWMEKAAKDQDSGETMVWFNIFGFFWFPRVLFGIEPHLLAFYDHPKLMHRINQDLLEYHLDLLEKITKIFTPVVIVLSEDMCYNHGPMLSKECFDEFLAPYYRPLLKQIKSKKIVSFVDCDGYIHPIVPWLEEVGVEGILPLERMANVDIVQLRKDHPRFKLIGAFDKTVMKNGEQAMRKEFERILPVMSQGGYLPSVDHQTPPDVSLENYRLYVKLLKEYCQKASNISTKD